MAKAFWHTFSQEQASAIAEVLEYLEKNSPDAETARIAKKLKMTVRPVREGVSTVQVLRPEEEQLLSEVLEIMYRNDLSNEEEEYIGAPNS